MQVDSTGYKRNTKKQKIGLKFDRQINSTGYKSNQQGGQICKMFDRQINSTGYKRSNRIQKKILESHVGSAWRTGRGRKADDNFFFD